MASVHPAGAPGGSGHARTRDVETAGFKEVDPRLAMLGFLSDPLLDLGRRCLDRLRASAVLLDLERTKRAVAARLALQRSEWPAPESVDAWIDGRIDVAIEGLLDEDAIDERDQRAVAADDERYLGFALQLGVEPRVVRRAAVMFHRLPIEERAAFWAVVIDGGTLEQHAMATGCSTELAARRYERAVETFCFSGRRTGPSEPQRGRQVP